MDRKLDAKSGLREGSRAEQAQDRKALAKHNAKAKGKGRA